MHHNSHSFTRSGLHDQKFAPALVSSFCCAILSSPSSRLLVLHYHHVLSPRSIFSLKQEEDEDVGAKKKRRQQTFRELSSLVICVCVSSHPVIDINLLHAFCYRPLLFRSCCQEALVFITTLRIPVDLIIRCVFPFNEKYQSIHISKEYL